MKDNATPLPFTLANHDEAQTMGRSLLDEMPCSSIGLRDLISGEHSDLWHWEVNGLHGPAVERVAMATGISSVSDLRYFASICSPPEIAALKIAKTSRLALARYVATKRKSPDFYTETRGVIESDKGKSINRSYGKLRGFVYWAQSKRAKIHKVGFSEIPERRIKEIRIMVPDAEIRMTVEGTGESEKDAHELLADYCVGGEWFDAPEIEIKTALSLVSLTNK